MHRELGPGRLIFLRQTFVLCVWGGGGTPNHFLAVPSRYYNVLPRLVTHQTIICGALTVSKCLVGCYAGVACKGH